MMEELWRQAPELELGTLIGRGSFGEVFKGKLKVPTFSMFVVGRILSVPVSLGWH